MIYFFLFFLCFFNDNDEDDQRGNNKYDHLFTRRWVQGIDAGDYLQVSASV